MKRNYLIVGFLGVLLALERNGVATEMVSGTVFTYQGQLKMAGAPVNGTYDFVFRLFDHRVLGNQIGPTLTFDGEATNPGPISVVNGLFTAPLDFGHAFHGGALFLDIQVAPHVGGGGGARLTTLSPRQPINAAPRALSSDLARGATGTFRIGSGSAAEIVLGDDNAVKITRNPNTTAMMVVNPDAIHLVRQRVTGPYFCSGSGAPCASNDDCPVGRCGGSPLLPLCHSDDECPLNPFTHTPFFYCIGGETCAPGELDGGTLAIGLGDDCSVGKDPDKSGLTLKDPTGIRIVQVVPQGRCSGNGQVCTSDDDCPAGTCGQLGHLSCHTNSDCPIRVATQPCLGAETCEQDGPGNLKFGVTDLHTIGALGDAQGMTLRDPVGVTFLKSFGQVCSGSGMPCQSNADCPAGGCSGGVTPPGGCRANSDCGAGVTCNSPPPEFCVTPPDGNGQIFFTRSGDARIGFDSNANNLAIINPGLVRIMKPDPASEGRCRNWRAPFFDSEAVCFGDADCKVGACYRFWDPSQSSNIPCHSDVVCPSFFIPELCGVGNQHAGCIREYCKGGEACDPFGMIEGDLAFDLPGLSSIGAGGDTGGLTLRDPGGIHILTSFGNRCSGSDTFCQTDADCPAGGCNEGTTPPGGCRLASDCQGSATCTAPPAEFCFPPGDGAGQMFFTTRKGDASFGFDSAAGNLAIVNTSGLRILKPDPASEGRCSESREVCFADADCPVGVCRNPLSPEAFPSGSLLPCHEYEDCPLLPGQSPFCGLSVCLREVCGGGESCDPLGRLKGELAFDLPGLSSIGGDSVVAGLILRDPVGMRILQATGNTCSGNATACTSDLDCPAGTCGGGTGTPGGPCRTDADCTLPLTCSDPPPQTCQASADAPGKLFFGLTDECSIGSDETNGLTLSDPAGVRIANPFDPAEATLKFGGADGTLIDTGFATSGMRFLAEEFRFDQGFVGIGISTNPTVRLELPNVDGPGGVGIARQWIDLSSARWKEDIRPIDHALQKLTQLTGVYFRWKQEYGGGDDLGLVAEDVGQILPEVVVWEKECETASGVNYGRLIAVAVEAIKELHSRNQEQHETIETQRAELKEHQARIEELGVRMERLESRMTNRPEER